MIGYFDEFMKDYTVQKKAEIETAKGDFKEVWEDETEIKGILNINSGKDKDVANSLGTETSHVLYTRFLAMINNKNCKEFRIIDREGLIYNITYVSNPMDQDKYLKLFLSRISGVDDD